MVAQDGINGSAAVAGWSEMLGELHRRIGHRFARFEARERVQLYLVGLLGQVERKNGWRLAEAIGERDPQGVQRLLNSAKWDADAVRDDLREYVVEHLGDEKTGILIVDETGFLKKGEKSVGVSPQYTGTAGDTVNCQVCSWLTPPTRAQPSSTGHSTCRRDGRATQSEERRPAFPRRSPFATR